MNAVRCLFLLAAGLSVALSINGKSLYHSQQMILCTMPGSWPIRDDSGTPVDELDRSCHVHDNCYDDALEHHPCRTIFHSPFKLYSYNCDEASKTVTCGKDNNAREMFICECDRKAAECFARSTYNNDHLSSDQCQ
ncbi:phospholipase A2, minor isoenzyme-like [Limanda limanda]|uniref:phospholipase A2, minor isoenzyme-like n=1 Tax=Limanda limanda TaxID=27771 RepID=UPI0029C6D212|nr:phospholipase A2, minor isoenzyme-like [Limanda limanda]